MILINFPNAIVEGEIWETIDDPMLLQDGMLHINVGAISIDVSWFPEHDLLGEYVVTAYSLSWEDKIGKLCTNDPQEVIEFIEATVRHAQSLIKETK